MDVFAVIVKKAIPGRRFFTLNKNHQPIHMQRNPWSRSIPVEVIKKLKYKTKEDVLKRYINRMKIQTPLSDRIQGSLCKFPDLNPFATEGMKAWNFVKKKNHCTRKKLGRIINNRLVVQDSAGTIKSVTVDHIQRGRRRKANGSFDPPTAPSQTGMATDEKYAYTSVLNDDFHVHFTDEHNLLYDTSSKSFISSKTIKHDFLRVKITMKTNVTSTEYHAVISNPKETCKRHGKPLKKKNNSASSSSTRETSTKDKKDEKGLPFNVHMFMVDAISQGNMNRQTPRLVEILENDVDAMIFRAHGIHGDGTTSQLMAALAGRFTISQCFLRNLFGLSFLLLQTFKSLKQSNVF